MKRVILLILAIAAMVNVAEARQPGRGYRGFFDWTSSVRSESTGEMDYNGTLYKFSEGAFYTGFTTSHGYQIDPMFFVGAGFGFEKCGKFDYEIVPLFLEGRVDLEFNKFTPYGDLRVGANLADGSGFYLSPTIGYRFNWGRKVGLNLGVGLTLAGYKARHYDIVIDEDLMELIYLGEKNHTRAFFSFRLGFDF